MCRSHNLNFSSYWWEKNVVKWPAGVQPRFSSINQVYFVIVWSEAVSFVGSLILIFWVLERKKSKQLRLCLSSGLLFGGRLSRHLTPCRRLSISQARQLGRWTQQMAPDTLFPHPPKGNLNLHSCTVRRSCPHVLHTGMCFHLFMKHSQHIEHMLCARHSARPFIKNNSSKGQGRISDT